jgi:hypothetical protein
MLQGLHHTHALKFEDTYKPSMNNNNYIYIVFHSDTYCHKAILLRIFHITVIVVLLYTLCYKPSCWKAYYKHNVKVYCT